MQRFFGNYHQYESALADSVSGCSQPHTVEKLISSNQIESIWKSALDHQLAAGFLMPITLALRKGLRKISVLDFGAGTGNSKRALNHYLSDLIELN